MARSSLASTCNWTETATCPSPLATATPAESYRLPRKAEITALLQEEQANNRALLEGMAPLTRGEYTRLAADISEEIERLKSTLAKFDAAAGALSPMMGADDETSPQLRPNS
jgi:hypothetical protein